MRTFFFVTFILLLSGCSNKPQSTVSIENLRCEYRQNPLGIDVPHPRFSWELVSGEQQKSQKAYQILVATESVALANGKADTWNSGKTRSNATNQIVYAGKPLQAYTQYYWKVRIWDEQGNPSAWSTAAQFSMGLLAPGDWQAQWIGDEETPITHEQRFYPHWGYCSESAAADTCRKFIIIDLGSEYAVDTVKMYPFPNGWYHQNEKLFPPRFTIELANRADFKDAVVAVNETAHDVTVAQGTPYERRLTTPVKGRYVRLNVHKLPSVRENIYEYGFSEFEIFSNGENVAYGKPVQATDYCIDGAGWRWTPDVLTDGYYKPNGRSGGYYKNIAPSPLLRKEIQVEKKVKRAFFYASALGIYEATLNGAKIGKQYFAPEWTDYDSHTQYQTYDVSGLLQEGANVLGVMLSDGWYAGPRWSYPARGGYGYFRKFIGQLMIYYEDGSSEVVATDDTWKYLAEGPISETSFYGGELYNAKKNPEGWDKPGYNDSKWVTPAVYPNEQVTLVAQLNEPIAVIEELKPTAIHKVGAQKYIFDFGKNIVGWSQLLLPYNPKQKLTFRYAEVLDDAGALYMKNLRLALQIDYYTPAGEQKINYEPRFTYHGFRFVEVDGLTQAPQPNNIVAKVVASSAPAVSTFACSDKDVNTLWENIRRTQYGNLISVPTDCPQRDEREGWMGDAQVFSQTAMYNLDMAAFYTKWVRDIRDSQLPDGRFTDISPHDGEWQAIAGAPGWADAGVIVPWRTFVNYNDKDILLQHYEAMKKFIDLLHKHNPDFLWKNVRGPMYGDWLNGNSIIADDYPKTGGTVPNDIFATAYFANSTTILAKTAKLLGKEKEYKHYSQLAAAIRKAFTEAYVSADGVIEGNTQAGYAIALQFGVLPDTLRTKAAAHMVEAIKAYDYRLSTGIHTTICLMNQLSEYGYSDVAYKLFLSHRFPSWLYSVDQGATTIWERWDGYVAGRGFQDPGMNSLNHVAIGSVGEWMYRHILGIQPDEAQAGYRHFYVKPQPGTLAWARGSYHAITGNIEVAWTNEDGVFNLDVTVPVNTTATVVLPDNTTYKVGSGKYAWNSKL